MKESSCALFFRSPEDRASQAFIQKREHRFSSYSWGVNFSVAAFKMFVLTSCLKTG